MKAVTYRKTYNSRGDFEGIELVQGSDVITLSLAGEGTHFAGYRWSEVKEIVDAFEKAARKEALERAGISAEEQENKEGE